MSLAIVHSRASLGLHAPAVTVEVHLSNGLPAFNLVGLPDTGVKESKERVRSAILNAGFEFPARRITVNLAPADLPKDGARFDLPIAVGILAAAGNLPLQPLQQTELIGELALSGALNYTPGTLTSAIAAQQAQRALLLPQASLREARLCRSATLLPADHLSAVCAHFNRITVIDPAPPTSAEPPSADGSTVDMADVAGQPQAKRAFEIAAAGGHNLLMVGPPGAGKSMLAARLASLLPPLSEQEQLTVVALNSLHAGRSQLSTPVLPSARPFRTPHHTASAAALVGGGSHPKPGEISLAHHGVLFLDELPEFNRKTLEALREPLETGEITLSRARMQVAYPARFQLIAAMNPCPCGKPDTPPPGCVNPQHCCERYQHKLSGPLLDRIDLQLTIQAVPLSALQSGVRQESSADIRARVLQAQQRQLAERGVINRDLQGKQLMTACALSASLQTWLESAAEKLGLSARAYHRVLRVARTIADLAAKDQLDKQHLGEALSYRIR